MLQTGARDPRPHRARADRHDGARCTRTRWPSTRRSTSPASPTSPTARPTSCRAARPSGCASPWRWSATPTCWCSTSRPSRWTSRPAMTFWATMRGFADRGKTVVFATHYLEEADAYADRIILMARGRGRRRRPGHRDQGAASGCARSGPRCPAPTWTALAALPGVTQRRPPRRHRHRSAARDSDAALRALLTALPGRPRHRGHRRRPRRGVPATDRRRDTATDRRRRRRPADDHATYTRYELAAPVRNKRFFIFSLASRSSCS